jgi:hypothetical protein
MIHGLCGEVNRPPGGGHMKRSWRAKRGIDNPEALSERLF